jgi:hypothetical protein
MRVVLFVGALALAGWGGFRHYEQHVDQQRFGSIATALAGRHVSVHCQGAVGALVDVSDRSGSVEFDAEGHPAGSTNLARSTCKALSRIAHGRRQRLAVAAGAVETLAHESYHLAGVRDEAVTECYGLQGMTFVARRLGATPGQARAYVTYAWARYPGLPFDYQTADCTDGGRLDLHPETGAWP